MRYQDSKLLLKNFVGTVGPPKETIYPYVGGPETILAPKELVIQSPDEIWPFLCTEMMHYHSAASEFFCLFIVCG